MDKLVYLGEFSADVILSSSGRYTVTFKHEGNILDEFETITPDEIGYKITALVRDEAENKQN